VCVCVCSVCKAKINIYPREFTGMNVRRAILGEPSSNWRQQLVVGLAAERAGGRGPDV